MVNRAECRETQPDVINKLYTMPYEFVPRASLLHAIGFAADDCGEQYISMNMLNRVRVKFHKRVLSVLGSGGACLVPHDALAEFEITHFRPIPESVYHLPENQRRACELIWSHVKRVSIVARKIGEKMIEELRPMPTEESYQTLEKVVQAITVSAHHSVVWTDVMSGEPIGTSGTQFIQSMKRLNDFMAETQIPVRLKPTHFEPYHYAFRWI